MTQKSTHYFFQYAHFAGKEQSLLINSDISLDVDYWLSLKLEELISSAPEVPDELIKRILKKANVC
ncbi:MAG: hypothetical protein EHM93_03530 [Bacteroidales bacterium]|nr:MAG: hypothetical protein EHM93_03530 [Bacteroidales bacterium]